MKTSTSAGALCPALALLVALLSGCSPAFHQPTRLQPARLGEETALTADLRNLPAPQEKIVAAVYKFRDQTGQLKPSETGASWSTAITQGTTTILLKALEESGWFVPIERENLANLQTERQIILRNQAQYKLDADLPPLYVGGVILEGGIVSYDANTLTGGAGLRFFGTGGSSQYRQDRVTVYLRAVATKSGKILKTVYTSKTILSQAVDAGIFRYVRFKRLLEAETGYATNEPAQMAVTEAIEKAVQALVLEGIRDSLWTVSAKDLPRTRRLLDAYEEEKREMAQTDLYGARETFDPPRLTVQPYAALWRYQGDLLTRGYRTGYGFAADLSITPHWGLQLNLGVGSLGSAQRFRCPVSVAEASVFYRGLPRQRITPVVFAGAGLIACRVGSSPVEFEGKRYAALQGGAGTEYVFNSTLGLRATLAYHQPLTDALDRTVAGRYRDYYLRGSLGLTYYLGRSARTPVSR